MDLERVSAIDPAWIARILHEGEKRFLPEAISK